jgi:hypothetical protein
MATDTHSKYVILIAFPPQQWLHECTAMLCHVYYITCLVNTFASIPRSSKWHLSFWFSNENPISNSLPSHVCHMPSQSNTLYFGDPTNIGWRVWVMEFVLMQFSTLSYYFIPLKPNYLPNCHVVEHFLSLFIPECARWNFTCKMKSYSFVYFHLHVFYVTVVMLDSKLSDKHKICVLLGYYTTYSKTL